MQRSGHTGWALAGASRPAAGSCAPNLPHAILVKIVALLPQEDRFRARMVCSTWHIAELVASRSSIQLLDCSLPCWLQLKQWLRSYGQHVSSLLLTPSSSIDSYEFVIDKLPCSSLFELVLSGAVLQTPLLAPAASDTLTKLVLTSSIIHGAPFDPNPAKKRTEQEQQQDREAFLQKSQHEILQEATQWLQDRRQREEQQRMPAQQRFLRELRTLTSLRHLALSVSTAYGRPLPGGDMWGAVQGMTHLTHLDLSSVYGLAKGCGEGLSGLTKLQVLCMQDRSPAPPQQQQQQQLSVLQHLPELRRLQLIGQAFTVALPPSSSSSSNSSGTGSSSSSGDGSSRGVVNPGCLTSLHLQQCTVSIRDESALTHLRVLTLKDLKSVNVRQLYGWLPQLQALVYLSLGGTSVAPGTAAAAAAGAAGLGQYSDGMELAGGITASRVLQHLDLSGVEVPRAAWSHMFDVNRRGPLTQLTCLQAPKGLRVPGQAHLVTLNAADLRALSDSCPELKDLEAGRALTLHADFTNLPNLTRLVALRTDSPLDYWALAPLGDLQILKLRGGKKWRQDDFSCLQCLPSLSCLSLDAKVGEEPRFTNAVFSELARLTHLQKLDMRDISLSDRQLRQLTGFTCLSHLRFSPDALSEDLRDRVELVHSTCGQDVSPDVKLQDKVCEGGTLHVWQQLQECFIPAGSYIYQERDDLKRQVTLLQAQLEEQAAKAEVEARVTEELQNLLQRKYEECAELRETLDLLVPDWEEHLREADREAEDWEEGYGGGYSDDGDWDW